MLVKKVLSDSFGTTEVFKLFAGYVRTHIVMNPSLWGIVTNEFAERKLQRVAGTGIAGQTAASVALGRVTVVGEGKNVITHLNVLDGKNLTATH
jgi:hypothetical protein